MKLKAPEGGLESIDELVDEKQEELDAIYSRFHGPDATEEDPLTLTLRKQEERNNDNYNQ